MKKRAAYVEALVVTLLLLAPPLAQAQQTGSRAPYQVLEEQDAKTSALLRSMANQMKTAPTPRDESGRVDFRGFSTEWVRVSREGQIQVYVKLNELNDDSLQELREAGMVTEKSNSKYKIVQGWIPYDALDLVAELDNVKGIRPPDYPIRRSKVR